MPMKILGQSPGLPKAGIGCFFGHYSRVLAECWCTLSLFTVFDWHETCWCWTVLQMFIQSLHSEGRASCVPLFFVHFHHLTIYISQVFWAAKACNSRLCTFWSATWRRNLCALARTGWTCSYGNPIFHNRTKKCCSVCKPRLRHFERWYKPFLNEFFMPLFHPHY